VVDEEKDEAFSIKYISSSEESSSYESSHSFEKERNSKPKRLKKRTKLPKDPETLKKIANQCKWCKIIFKTIQEYRAHRPKFASIKDHGRKQNKKRRCTLCPTFFEYHNKAEVIHMACVHGIFTVQPTLNCTHCDLKFNEQGLLWLHKQKVHSVSNADNLKSKCEMCLKYFYSSKNLKVHKKSVHFGNKESQEGRQIENIKCFLCADSQFISLEGLKVHEESKEHQDNLKSRITVHCNVCRANFHGDVEALQLHLKMAEHEEEVQKLGNYDQGKFCVPCRQEFETFEQLKIHEACGVEHKEICEAFQQSTERNEKVNETFICDVCAKVFKSKYFLQQHLNKFHPPGGHKCKVIVG